MRQCDGSDLGPFGFERILRDSDQLIKRSLICRGEVSHNLPVEGHLRGFQSLDQSAVSHARSPGGSIYTDLPERSEVALLGPSISIGVLPAVIQRIGGVAI